MGKEYYHSLITCSVEDRCEDACCMFVFAAEYEEGITSRIPSN